MTRSNITCSYASRAYIPFRLLQSILNFVKLVILSVLSAALAYPLLFLIFTPILLYRQLVKLIVKISDKKCGGILAGTDAFLASPDPYTNIPMTLAPYFTFTSKVDRNRILKVVSEQIIQPNLFPELTQRIVRRYGYFFRHAVDNFDLEHHIIYYNPECPEKPVKRSEIRRRFFKKIGNPPFDPSRSPWELVIIPNFVDDNNPSLKSCVFLRVNHCLMDGYSMVSFIQKAALTPWKMPVGPSVKESRMRVTAKTIMKLLEAVLTGPYHAICIFCSATDNSDFVKKATTILSKEDEEKGVRERESCKIEGERLKKVRSFYKAGVSSLLITMVAEGVIKYMRHQCKNNDFGEMPKQIAIQLSFPLPGHPFAMTNHWTCVGIPVKVHKNPDPVKTLKSIHETYERVRTSILPLIPYVISKLIGLLPLHLLPDLSKLPSQTIIMGNMPGPTQTVDMFGYEWTDFGFLGSSSSASAFFATIQNLKGKFWFDIGCAGTLFQNQDDMNLLEDYAHGVLSDLEAGALAKTNGSVDNSVKLRRS